MVRDCVCERGVGWRAPRKGETSDIKRRRKGCDMKWGCEMVKDVKWWGWVWWGRCGGSHLSHPFPHPPTVPLTVRDTVHFTLTYTKYNLEIIFTLKLFIDLHSPLNHPSSSHSSPSNNMYGKNVPGSIVHSSTHLWLLYKIPWGR